MRRAFLRRWTVGSLIPRCRNPLGRVMDEMSECRDATVGTLPFSLFGLAGINTPRTPASHAIHAIPAHFPSTPTRTPSRLSLLSGDANDDTDATPVACPTTLTAQYHTSPPHPRNPTINGNSGPRYHLHYSPGRAQETNEDPSRGRLSHGQIDPLAEKRHTRDLPQRPSHSAVTRRTGTTSGNGREPSHGPNVSPCR